jgi:hypothetical protein
MCKFILRISIVAWALVLTVPRPGDAGKFGVPTNLDTNGAPTASSVLPPGWLILDGTSSGAADGDVMHQMRLFIEVTGTTLDIRVFDPFTSGARDYPRCPALCNTPTTTTTYQLRRPDGTIQHTVSGIADTATTDDRLVRFTPTGFVSIGSGSALAVTPGLYELRISMGAGDDINAFGVDIRQDVGNAPHYNVFTIGTGGTATATRSSLLAGAINNSPLGTPASFANIVQPMGFYPYVIGGCACYTNNFDMDNYSGGSGFNSAGIMTDLLGSQTTLAMGTTSTTNAASTVTVEATNTVNLSGLNYGTYLLTNNVGTQQNIVDWRVANWQGWSSTPAATPYIPTNPIRMYLPNDYSPPITASGSGATAPLEPDLTINAFYVSGQNPPAANQNTVFNITATVQNPTSQPLTNVVINIGLATNVTYSAGSYQSTFEGVSTACTFTSGAGFARCDFGSTPLPTGQAASLNITAVFRPTSNTPNLQSLTSAPAATTSGTLSPEGITRYIPTANTTTWASFTPVWGAGSYARTEYLGPLCNLVVNVNSGAPLATRASFGGMRVTGSTVEFATLSQRGTVGFNVYGLQTARPGGPRTLLTAQPIPAATRNSLTPILYRADVGASNYAYLAIEEIDARGRHQAFGPFSISDPRLLQRFERIEARLQQAGTRERGGARMVSLKDFSRIAGAARGHATRWPSMRRGSDKSQGIKIEVPQAGEVSVPLAVLTQHGLPAEVATHPERLRLTSQGRSVAFEITRNAAGAAEAVRFTAARLSTTYSGKNAYVLSWRKNQSDLQMVSLTREEEAPRPGKRRLEVNSIFISEIPQGSDAWLWERLTPGEETVLYTLDWTPYTFDAPEAGKAKVLARVVATSNHVHTVTLLINGVAAGTTTFRGPGSATIDGVATLSTTGNSIAIGYSPSASGEGEPEAFFNYVDVDFPDEAGAASIPLEQLTLTPYDPDLPNLQGVQYLIVTHPLFHDQAHSIASLKRAEGYHVGVVDVERAYDHFSGGIIEPNAVRALIRHAAGDGHLQYVLLVGDDTLDPRDFVGAGEISFIPSLFATDGESQRTPADNRYADLDDDGAPDVAIGRLPVKTPEEASLLVAKISHQGAALHGARKDHLFVVSATTAEDSVSFRKKAEALATQLPSRKRTTFVDPEAVGLDEARRLLLESLGQGAAFTHYLGHGHPEFWANRSADQVLLGREDLATLEGTNRETVLFAWTCEAQDYLYMFGPSINEAMLLMPQGGAVASFGPAGITDPALQAELAAVLYQEFFTKKRTLGEAIRRAKAKLVADNPAMRPIVEGWNLLGDPALRIPD